jgi:hypothetical protein
MVTLMLDERDPDLLKAFAQARETPADDAFMAAVLMKVERARRTRLRRQALAIAAAVAFILLNRRLVWEGTAAAVSVVGDLSPTYATWLVSPVGWVVSTLIGVCVVLRSRPSRR